ncbi:DUF1214 domain-containing protein [Agromyces subbeticus]|uniref:DUF1214 domain-containing protein n=1 Tax=Agromyces subbeticus TaxID=293890 RepID=UPI0003B50023|nr:DUF1214 domain-containing protein [Agromyces subbeticus]
MASSTFQLPDSYVRLLTSSAYLWAWPLINMHNRQSVMRQLPAPGLLKGIAPVAPLGRLAMLRDYVEPAERLVACPNQDVAYGFGMVAAEVGPSIIQVPDFGGRFWVYQAVDQRTDSFVSLGAMYDTAPGFYLLAPTGWEGHVPDQIAGVFRFDTAVGVVIPRVFMDDTAEDRLAIAALVDQICMYPLAEFDGTTKTMDWSAVPSYGDADDSDGEVETRWVDPGAFVTDLSAVLDEVPPRPGETALYDWFRTLVDAAAVDPRVHDLVVEAAKEADAGPIQDLFEFRNIGIPSAAHWTTQRNGAQFGTDYLARTAMAKANIFVNSPNETCYYYQDLDANGDRLDGAHSYSVTFAAGDLPPVDGFWSLTLYNEHHFFHANDLNRYSLGTKNKTLHIDDAGALTITAGGPMPTDPEAIANWLPAPDGAFSLYLRAYGPTTAILDQTWTPAPVIPA